MLIQGFYIKWGGAGVHLNSFFVYTGVRGKKLKTLNYNQEAQYHLKLFKFVYVSDTPL